MKKAVVIGGRGKIGTYLVPMLVKAGYEVACVTRSAKAPAVWDDAWNCVTDVSLDRRAEGFEEAVAALKPDVVVDTICFTDADMRKLIDALRGKVQHYVVVGSMWMHGRSEQVPVREEECREPLEEYGIQKEKMDRTIAGEYEKNGFPGTIVHPGHIVCPGDVPINPQGCKSLEAFRKLKDGQQVLLPNFGMETIHHVHAKDVAGVIFAAITAGKPAFGQGFHAVSRRAVTLYGYAKEAAKWYGKEANLAFAPFDEWKKTMSQEDADATWTHITHCPSGSMEKARALLGFEPEYSTYEAVRDCLKSFDL